MAPPPPPMPYLAEEIISEILLRLPARHLARCRAVCRAWRLLATDSAFLMDHHHRQQARPLVYFLCSGNGETKNFRVDALDLRGGAGGAKNLRGGGGGANNLRADALDIRAGGGEAKNLGADALGLRGGGGGAKNLGADALGLRADALDIRAGGGEAKNLGADALGLRAGGSEPIILFSEPMDEDGVEITLELHGCCAGLLLLSFTDGLTCREQLYVCNPATQQTAAVPWIDIYKIAGFYQHGQSAEYRVLYHRGAGDGKTYEVLSLNSGHRRCIGRPVASEADTDAVAWLARGPKPACWEPPALLHGSLHWPPQLESSGAILAFDTLVEKFRCIPSPVQPGSVSSLFDMDGTLALSNRRDPMEHPVFVDLWLLEDYDDTATWLHVRDFKFRSVEDSILRFRWPRGSFIVSRRGDVVVDCTEVLLRFDKEGELLGTIHDKHYLVKFSLLLLKENLTSQPFFEENASGTGCTAVPPFFDQLRSLR